MLNALLSLKVAHYHKIYYIRLKWTRNESKRSANYEKQWMMLIKYMSKLYNKHARNSTNSSKKHKMNSINSRKPSRSKSLHESFMWPSLVRYISYILACMLLGRKIYICLQRRLDNFWWKQRIDDCRKDGIGGIGAGCTAFYSGTIALTAIL